MKINNSTIFKNFITKNVVFFKFNKKYNSFNNKVMKQIETEKNINFNDCLKHENFVSLRNIF